MIQKQLQRIKDAAEETKTATKSHDPFIYVADMCERIVHNSNLENTSFDTRSATLGKEAGN